MKKVPKKKIGSTNKKIIAIIRQRQPLAMIIVRMVVIEGLLKRQFPILRSLSSALLITSFARFSTLSVKSRTRVNDTAFVALARELDVELRTFDEKQQSLFKESSSS